jgi:hypothetical protein
MSGYNTIRSDEGRRSYYIVGSPGIRNRNIHTHEKDDEVQFAVTFTPATTKAEKKNKDTSGGAIEKVRRDISYPKVRVVRRFQVERSTRMHLLKGVWARPVMRILVSG